MCALPISASWLHDHRMLLWLPVRRRAVDQFEEMAVQMDRVRHHRIVDEFHTDTFVIGEANGVVANGSKLLAVERPHVARSEERRVGKECVSMCRSRWSPYP